jgi:hypothetical protein
LWRVLRGGNACQTEQKTGRAKFPRCLSAEHGDKSMPYLP